MPPWRGPGGRSSATQGGSAAALRARPSAHGRRRQTERAAALPGARASAQPRHVPAAAPAPGAPRARGDWAASGSGLPRDPPRPAGPGSPGYTPGGSSAPRCPRRSQGDPAVA